MSFQKINICRSTEVAFNVFHMFKNNTVNMTQDDFSALTTNEDDSEKDRLFSLTASLLEGECSEVRVHEINTCSTHYPFEGESRLVQFLIQPRRYIEKVIFGVTVSRSYVDGDEVSGWSSWKMSSAKLQTFGKGKQQESIFIGTHGATRDDNVSPSAKENITGRVYFDRS
jgi:hypothetical protein